MSGAVYWEIYFLSVLLLAFIVNSQNVYKIVSNYRGIVRVFPAGDITSFFGIPYTLPPLNKQRFREPVYYEVKKGTIHNATALGPLCMQPRRFLARHERLKSLVMSENCLTLNIMVPSVDGNVTSSNDVKFPVILYIHSGDFISGGGAMLNGEDVSLKTKSIVVSLNYRLGIFGFFSFNRTIPTNLGIMDIATALKWINNNIDKFQGDPNNINILAPHHTLNVLKKSLRARRLFHKGISFDDGYHDVISTSIPGDIKVYNMIMNLCKKIHVLKCLHTLGSEEFIHIADKAIEEWQIIPFQPIVDDHVVGLTDVSVGGVPDNLILSISSSLPQNSLVSFWIDQSNPCSEETYSKAIGYLQKSSTGRLANMTALILESYFYPVSFRNDRFCSSIERIFFSSSKTRIVQNANRMSLSALTFLLLGVQGDNNMTSEVMSSRACSLVDDDRSCPGRLGIEDGIVQAMYSFAHHGFPEIKGLPWRPYTQTSRNHIQVAQNQILVGNYDNWPLRREQLLWDKLLPSLKRQSIREIVIATTSGGHRVLGHSDNFDWGMTTAQLEALLFSLILICLFLTVVCITLVRIICYVRGKPFVKREHVTTNPSNQQSYAVQSLDEQCKCNGHPHTLQEHHVNSHHGELNRA